MRRVLQNTVFLAALWTTACGAPTAPGNRGAPSTVLSLDNRDNGRGVSVAVDDEVDITLQTIGPGNYDEHPSVSSPAVAFLAVSNVGPPNPGGPRQLFQFRAVAAGHAVVSIPHTGQNPRFEIAVDVR